MTLIIFRELEDLLSLKKPYSQTDIEKNKDNLRKNLLKTEKLGYREEAEYHVFFR